ncbi:hypothetical protein AHAS_Ahas14G0099400 [Arachis hypogaea]
MRYIDWIMLSTLLGGASDLEHQTKSGDTAAEQIRPYLRRAGFEYGAYMVEFEHDWSLASALIKRWRPESYTFHLPCGEMTITLQDVAYQLGLRIDGDPISGCIGGWEQHHQGRTL